MESLKGEEDAKRQQIEELLRVVRGLGRGTCDAGGGGERGAGGAETQGQGGSAAGAGAGEGAAEAAAGCLRPASGGLLQGLGRLSRVRSCLTMFNSYF